MADPWVKLVAAVAASTENPNDEATQKRLAQSFKKHRTVLHALANENPSLMLGELTQLDPSKSTIAMSYIM